MVCRRYRVGGGRREVHFWRASGTSKSNVSETKWGYKKEVKGFKSYWARFLSILSLIPDTCVQYPGLEGGGGLGNASTQGTPAGSIAASAHGGTYSHVDVAGGTWGRKRGAAAAHAATAARRRRATPKGGAVTPPHGAPAHDGRGGRHGIRARGWDRPPRDGAPLTAPLDGVRNRRRAAATEAGAQAR